MPDAQGRFKGISVPALPWTTPPSAARRAADAEELADAIAKRRYHYVDEYALQDAIAQMLQRIGYDVGREVRLNSQDRIDLLVDGIGIEVKVAGQPAAVVRQLRRYAACEEIRGLVLVTNRVRHQVPELGKPVVVVNIAKAGL